MLHILVINIYRRCTKNKYKADNKANPFRTVTIKKKLYSYIFLYINCKDNYNANNIKYNF